MAMLSLERKLQVEQVASTAWATGAWLCSGKDSNLHWNLIVSLIRSVSDCAPARCLG